MKTQYNKRFIPPLIIFFLCTILSFYSYASTETAAGELARLKGTVLIRQDRSSKPAAVSAPGKPLLIGNELRTRKKSMAFIKWIDGSKIVMKEKSKLSIKAVDYFDVNTGQVMFDISKIKRPRPVRVGVKLALLGIRGTRFVVSSTDDEYKIYLKKGNVTITSLNEDFTIYKAQIEAQMQKFREQMNREANEFKESLESEFDDFKFGHAEQLKEFNLIESAGISIKDNIITLISIPKEIDEQFKLLDSF